MLSLMSMGYNQNSKMKEQKADQRFGLDLEGTKASLAPKYHWRLLDFLTCLHSRSLKVSISQTYNNTTLVLLFFLLLLLLIKIEEVYNFDQDDLLPEDMLILDTHAEVFVWIS